MKVHKSAYLPKYEHLLHGRNDFDIDFIYGGRDSGKSRFTAFVLLLCCMELPYFRCLLVRKVKDTVRGSQFALLKGLIDLYDRQNPGFRNLFKVNETRMEIIYKKNGNGFYGRGLDDASQIKSFDNPSHCWVEEGNQIEREDFVIILTSLRAETKVKVWFTFNPECETNYTEFWLWKDWFAHTTELEWEHTNMVEIPPASVAAMNDTQRAKLVQTDGVYYVPYRSRATHSTYKDNGYCDPSRIALYESYKIGEANGYWYQVYTLGLWGFRRTGGEFLKRFDEKRNIQVNPLQKQPLHVVVDKNRNPYIAIAIHQMDMTAKKLRQVHELPCSTPDNTATAAATRLVNWLDAIGHADMVYLYGDPSANTKTTEDDLGRSFFDKFRAVLRDRGVKFTDRIQRAAPGVALSGDFVNHVLEGSEWCFMADPSCRVSIEDYTMTKEAMDGTMLKKKITDKVTGQTYEKHGHYTDNLRYFITTVLAAEYARYASRRKSRGSLVGERG